MALSMSRLGTGHCLWCGLAKLDDDGSVKKAVRTSCAVVTDFGEETRALTILLDFLQKQADAAEL